MPAAPAPTRRRRCDRHAQARTSSRTYMYMYLNQRRSLQKGSFMTRPRGGHVSQSNAKTLGGSKVGSIVGVI
eukprot:423878-Prymnesium_polylepis.4